jgi:toxin secretion/phage lysis holin
MNQFYVEISRDWQKTGMFFSALVCFSFIDIVLGTLLAGVKGKANSSAARTGISRKIAAVFVVAAACVFDALIPEVTLPILGPSTLGAATAFAIILWEAHSILENAGQLGVPIGPFAKYLERVRNSFSGADSPPLASPSAEESK